MLPCFRLRAGFLLPVVGFSACALLLSGCSAASDGSDQASGEPELGKIPVMLQTAGLDFPLDSYDPSKAERATLERARTQLVSQCMARFGFTYTAPQQPDASHDKANSRVFGVVDPDAAARYGYQNPNAASPPSKPSVNLTAAEKLALSGGAIENPASMPMSQQEAEKRGGGKEKINGRAVPIGGCIREAFLKLYAPQPNAVDMLYVFNLKGQAESLARADSRVRENDKKWSACMRKAGYSVTDPMKASLELGFEGQKLASSRAITAAKADVSCKKETNLVGVRYTVQSTYQKRLIDKNAETLSLAEQQLQDRLKLAARLTG